MAVDERLYDVKHVRHVAKTAREKGIRRGLRDAAKELGFEYLVEVKIEMERLREIDRI